MNYPGNISLTQAAGLSTEPLPVSLYTDPDHYALEQERIFRRAWLKVGRVEQIAEPGDFFTKEIAILKASVIVTRTKDGGVRAFHNVCSHRGNQVVLIESGKASRFTCRYHNWTYKNSGELIGVPDEESFFDLDKKKCGLTPMACETWGGWIFINFQPEPETTLKEFLGPLGDALGSIPYPHASENVLILRGEIKANWKAVSDAFMESYHVRSIHPKTLAPAYAGGDNPFSRPLGATVYGQHIGYALWANPQYQPSPSARIEKWVYPNLQTVTGTAQAGQANPLLDHPGVNPSGAENWAQDTNLLFPNCQIQISANRFWSHEFWPTGVNSTIWEGRFWQPHATSFRERIQLEHFVAQMSDAMLEDLDNIESTQRGMESGGKSLIQLQDGEIMIRHALQHVQKWTAADSVAEAMA